MATRCASWDSYATSHLANGGETLAIRDPAGRTVLEIEYDDSGLWPQAADGIGAALELVGPDTISTDRLSKPTSWQSSVSYGGTPGALGPARPTIVINEVLSASSDPGEIDQIEIFNFGTQSVDIGGWYLSDSGREPLKYKIPDGVPVAPGQFVVFDELDFNPGAPDDDSGFALSRFGDDVWLSIANGSSEWDRLFIDEVHFPAALESVPFGRVPDGDGRLLPVSSSTFGEPNAEVRPPEIVIGEVHYHPELPSAAALEIDPGLSTDDLEFVEICNRSSAIVNLSQWRIRGGVEFDFPAGTELDSGEVLLIVPFDLNLPENTPRLLAFRANYGLDPSAPLLGGYQGKLSDSMDWVRLLRPLPGDGGDVNHGIEDEMIYDDQPPWPTSADGSGKSLHRDLSTDNGTVPQNWYAHVPTPGRLPSLAGDFDADGSVSASDIDLLCAAIGSQDDRFDLDSDGDVDLFDHKFLVEEILGTTYGDANLDGFFDTADLVQLFQAAQYEDGVVGNSTWATGDWNCDREFGTADLVLALRTGAYERVVANAIAHTPRPSPLQSIAAAIAWPDGRKRGQVQCCSARSL